MESILSRQTIVALGKIVGSENVVTKGELIAEAEASTYQTKQRILGIVKPGSATEIREVLKLAGTFKIPLHVYSTGKNWGYGSRISPTNRCLLVDLSRINKIVDYNEDLGHVTIEPGVTQKQLYDFLQDKNSPFGVCITSSAPDTSIIGNICERGVGVGPYGFRSHHISNMEVILPTGELIHTGFGRYANAQAANAYPEGIGPSFSDVFLQSNYGIITKLTMYLVPTPAYSRHIHVSITKDTDLPKYLDILRTFNFFSTARKFVSFRNDLEFLLPVTQYPWDVTDKTPLAPHVAAELKQKFGIDFSWQAIAIVYGYTRPEVTAQISYFKSLAKDLDGVSVSPIYTQNTIGLMPVELGGSSYWRMRTPPPEVKRLDTDGCGLIRLSIAVPFAAGNIVDVIETMRAVISEYKYEPFIEGHCISERTVLVVTPIIFDRTVPGEDENALRCHDALLKALMNKGYYPYRDNGRAQTLFPESSDDFDAFRGSIKHTADPGGILSPGKYGIK
jgi:4-cresol dehydrogenase (hydroxylating)